MSSSDAGRQTMVPVGLQKEGPGYLGNGWSFFIGVFDGTVARTPTVPIEGATLVREGARLLQQGPSCMVYP